MQIDFIRELSFNECANAFPCYANMQWKYGYVGEHIPRK